MIWLLLSCVKDEPADSATGTGSPVETGSPIDSVPPDDTETPVDTVDTDPGEPPRADELAVTVHPEVGSFLVASWTQNVEAEVHLEFRVGDEAWRSSPAETRAAGEQEELVLGVPFGADVAVRVVLDEVTSDEVVGTTDAAPDGLPVPELLVADDTLYDVDVPYVLLSYQPEGRASWLVVLDRQARVVWAMETPNGHTTGAMHLDPDGGALLVDERVGDETSDNQVHRMTLLGEILESIAVPGMHHSFQGLPGGGIAWGGTSKGQEVLRVHDPDGTVRQLWDCSAFWAAHGATMDCDGNAVWWNDVDGTIWFSSDNHNTVVELHPETGEVLRYWGELEGAWGYAEGSKQMWKQHGPRLTPDGTLLVSSHFDKSQYELVGREFELDEDAEQLVELGSCGVGSGLEVRHSGEAHGFGNGNTLLNYGPTSHLREYTPDCAIAWDASWEEGISLRRTDFPSDLYDLVP